MRSCLSAIALLALVLVVPVRAGDKEQDKFQGTWLVVSAERDGQANNDIKDDKLVIQGDKMTVQKGKGGEDTPVTFKLDPTKKPKEINVTTPGGDALGIYELEGETLKICFGRPGKERPKEFGSKADSGLMNIVLKKAK